MSESSNNSKGIGFVGMLTILFVGLKLTHYIEWSWWWILSPVWITASVVILLLVLAGITMLYD